MTITPNDIAREKDVFVASYDDNNDLVAIHFAIDNDFPDVLAAAEAGRKPPSGGCYRIFLNPPK